MPRLREYRCKTGEPPHDEAFMCGECLELVCGYHGERSLVDDDLLCPDCYRREQAGIAHSNALRQEDERG